VAATAFHWIDPQVRTAKVAAALRGGALACEWEVSYSTAAYLEVLGTTSGHRALEPAVQAPSCSTVSSA
jgi:hypothetical protein